MQNASKTQQKKINAIKKGLKEAIAIHYGKNESENPSYDLQTLSEYVLMHIDTI